MIWKVFLLLRMKIIVMRKYKQEKQETNSFRKYLADIYFTGTIVV